MAYASFSQRLSSAGIDGTIFFLLLIIVSAGAQEDPALASVIFAITLIFYLLVTIILYLRYSGTPGTLLLNCQLVSAETGDPITGKQAMLRILGLLLTVASAGAGFLWILFNRNRQALHDRIAGTIVVYNAATDLFDESQKSLHQLLSEVR